MTMRETRAPKALEIAEPVARILGATASALYDHGATITWPDGSAVFVRVDRHGYISASKARAEISVSLPNDTQYRTPYGEKRPEISVSVTRTPEAIASEITRRILPAARAQYAEHVRLGAERDDAAAGRKRSMDKLRTVAGVTVYDGGRGGNPATPDETDREASVRIGDAWGSLKLNHDGQSATIDLHSVSVGAALKILRALQS